jgi:hypothetical protein
VSCCVDKRHVCAQIRQRRRYRCKADCDRATGSAMACVRACTCVVDLSRCRSAHAGPSVMQYGAIAGTASYNAIPGTAGCACSVLCVFVVVVRACDDGDVCIR